LDTDIVEPTDPLQQLLAVLQTPLEASEEELKPENLRYVLYARKSTTDETRQAKSHQIAECFDRVVKPDNITLEEKDIIIEICMTSRQLLTLLTS